MEHQDSILQVERAFPAIRRSVRKAATHRAASHHLHWEADRQVLVQRQEAAAPGSRRVLARRVHRSLGATRSGTLSARCSQLWTVWPAGSESNFGSHLCNPGARAKAPSQTSPLGGFPQARLRTRPATRPNGNKDEMDATTTSKGIPLVRIYPRIFTFLAQSCDERRHFPPFLRFTPNQRTVPGRKRSELLLATNETRQRHVKNASFTPNTRF